MMCRETEGTVNESTSRSDNELIEGSLHGDNSAFGALVLRYHKVVIAVAYRICGDGVLAEDVAQETFIRVWDRLSSYRPEGNFRGWICRIAANLTVDALRRRKPTAALSESAMAVDMEDPEGAVLRNERAAVVRAALMRLPLQSRTALVLREYEGLSYREIADALDIPLGTVKSRLSDARRRLLAELNPFLER
jgi:RNA polymerase sigma-70 factor (ECF subfamily)